MIKVVLFDVDGVITTGPMFSDRYISEFGIPPEDMTLFFENEFQECLVGRLDLREALEPYLGRWNWNRSVEELIEYWLSEDEVNRPLLNVVQRLQEKGVQCYLATNQEKYRTDYLFNKLELAQFFKDIFSSGNIGYKKPQSEYFEYIMDRLENTGKKEVLFWDDSEKFVQGAKDFGIHAELYTNFPNFQQKLSQYLNL